MKLIIGNLKMNLLTPIERERYLESFKKELKGKKMENSSIVLCPPSIHLEAFAKKIKNKSVAIGAQNIFWEERGSYTGEISASMVKNVGAQYVIVAHSERRRYFGETNESANAKIKAALKNGLVVVYCVGETKEERTNGETAEVIASQVMEGLAQVPATKAKSVVIAYEPVWAIGGDSVPTSNEIMEVRILIKRIITDTYGATIAEKIQLLYGGSVNALTVKQACVEAGMDGALIGRESLIPMEFLKIAEIIDNN